MAISVPPLAPLELAYKPDAADAQQRMRAYWAGEMIDRPCVRIVTPKDGRQPISRSLITAPDFDFGRAVDDFEEWASNMSFFGEAMPAFVPFYGPDQMSGYFGGKMTLVPHMDTSWVEPLVEDWETQQPLHIDPENKWWKGTLDLARIAARRCEGKFIVGALDTHSNLDCLSALRGPERICMDLIEYPDEVLKALKWIDAAYKPMYDAIYEAGRMAEFGTTCWVEMYSEGRMQCVQCDFSYMVSPEHFRRFILPSLEYECSVIDHAVYHLDGVGAFRHLDDLLSIPDLHTIQLVPGAGQPTAPHWLDMLKRIQQRGKSIQVFVTPDELKTMHTELEPAKTFYWVSDCYTSTEAENLLHWLVSHT